MLSKQIVKEYNKVRGSANKSLLCHAPFVNINFEQNGNMRACCYNVQHVLGAYPHNSIQEAWTGKKAEELRDYIRANDLSGGCKLCEELITSKNFNGAKALHYDLYADQGNNPLQGVINFFSSTTGQPLPKIFEFELSNTCNLECEMCSGYFSSSIRKNREKLPPLPNPYDDAFVEELARFIPHLTDMKFLGGEPFLIDVYHKIWDKALLLNPGVRIHITTNGTVINQRVRDLVQKMNCSITVSIDSLQPASYERIRAGAKFERVMANLLEFKEMVKAKKNSFSIAVCPMTDNWRELPDFVQFANEHDIDTHYNALWYPEHLSLRSLKPLDLRRAITYLEARQFNVLNPRHKLNLQRYKEVINNIKYWLNEAVAASQQKIYFGSNENTLLSLLPSESNARAIVVLTLKEKMDVLGYENYPLTEKIMTEDLKEFTETEEPLEVSFRKIAGRCTDKQFMLANFTALCTIQKIYFADKIDSLEFENKIEQITSAINQFDAIHPTVIEATICGSLINGVLQINSLPAELAIALCKNGVPEPAPTPAFTGKSFQPVGD